MNFSWRSLKRSRLKVHFQLICKSKTTFISQSFCARTRFRMCFVTMLSQIQLGLTCFLKIKLETRLKVQCIVEICSGLLNQRDKNVQCEDGNFMHAQRRESWMATKGQICISIEGKTYTIILFEILIFLFKFQSAVQTAGHSVKGKSFFAWFCL